ncbi:MAG: hypothetical protein VKL39_08545 [Leptolyngbyaceae bacterium]|nr:hypothetical protein [Leptolyngbyaceae bacterium]
MSDSTERALVEQSHTGHYRSIRVWDIGIVQENWLFDYVSEVRSPWAIAR